MDGYFFRLAAKRLNLPFIGGKQMKYISPLHEDFVRKTRRGNLLVILCRAGLLVLIVAFWEIAAKLDVIDPFIFSSPSRIIRTFAKLYGDGTLLTHLWVSTYETLAGFALGTLLGFLIATGLWWKDSLRRIFEPHLVVLNSLPKIALGPIIIVWAGTGAASIILMAVLISFIITALNMLSGFVSTDPDKILLMRTMKAKRYQLFFKLVLPANVPTLTSTLKINVGMAWVGSIMGEYLVSRAGLGYLIVYGSQVFNLDIVMTCTIALCALAGIMYGLVALAEKLALSRFS